MHDSWAYRLVDQSPHLIDPPAGAGGNRNREWQAVAYPEDEDHCGLIMEHHGFGAKDAVEEKVRRMALEGMKFRGQKVKDLKSAAAEHAVVKTGAAFAAVVLWN